MRALVEKDFRMHQFRLTQKEEVELRIAHRRAGSKKEADRIKSLILLHKGWTYPRIAEALLLDEETVRNYEHRYSAGGLDRLLKDQYLGGQSKLSGAETKELCGYLEENVCATAGDIAVHIEKRYGVKYTTSGVTDLLHRQGFVYKKTKLIPGKANAEKQKAFVEMYERLRVEKAPTDRIYFGDGVHPTHNTERCYCWVKKGKDKEIRSNTGRKRLNINGAIDIETKEIVTRQDTTLNAQSTVELLKELEGRHPQAENIYLIVDNATYYKCRLVSDYLAGSRVKMIFLPPYSPNLNLIERVWKLFRKKVTKGGYYEKFSEFRQACGRFFEGFGEYRLELNSLLTENFQILSVPP